jgi:ribose transport system substrate-binding protein
MMRNTIVLAILVLTAGCARPSTNDASRKVIGKRTIGVSVLTMNNPFFKEIADTLIDEASKQGYAVFVVDGANDVSTQQNQVKDFLAKGVSAIVLCPRDSIAIGPAIKEANDKEVPVFTADLACQAKGVRVVCHIATDNYAGGILAADAMIEALGESGGKIAVLDFKAAESCILRVNGFKKQLEAHNAKNPQARITIVTELPCDGSKDLGYKSAQDALQADADLAGIFAINDPAALGVVAALEK